MASSEDERPADGIAALLADRTRMLAMLRETQMQHLTTYRATMDAILIDLARAIRLTEALAAARAGRRRPAPPPVG